MNDEYGTEFYEQKTRKTAWTVEYNFLTTRHRPFGKETTDDLSYGTLEEFLDEREYFYQFRKWEEQWFRDHPDAPGYDVHDFPLYREPTKHIVNVGGGPS
jgi:hypothetical protein